MILNWKKYFCYILYCIPRNRLAIFFKLNGTWSWWKFFFWLWTKSISIWFIIKRKTEPKHFSCCLEEKERQNKNIFAVVWKKKKNCHNDHIPLKLNGNWNLFFWQQEFISCNVTKIEWKLKSIFLTAKVHIM